MSIINCTMQNLKKLKWYDIGIIKLSLIAFSLMLAVLLPALTKVAWQSYFIMFMICYVYLLFIMFKRQTKDKGLINKSINTMKGLTVFDWVIFKLCLITFSLMLAVLLPVLVEVMWRVYWVVFLGTYAYLLNKFMCCGKAKKEKQNKVEKKAPAKKTTKKTVKK